MDKILIIEDDVEINTLLTDFLKENGYVVYSQYDGLHVLDFLHKEKIDLIILDIMLPYRSGDIILADIRRQFTIPVLLFQRKKRHRIKLICFVLGQMITLQNLLIWKKCLPESKAICAEYSLKIVRLPVYNTGIYVWIWKRIRHF